MLSEAKALLEDGNNFLDFVAYQFLGRQVLKNPLGMIFPFEKLILKTTIEIN